MIVNAQKFLPTYKCKSKLVADYLIYKKNLSLLNVDENYWYFLQDGELDQIIRHLPLWLKIASKF